MRPSTPKSAASTLCAFMLSFSTLITAAALITSVAAMAVISVPSISMATSDEDDAIRDAAKQERVQGLEAIYNGTAPPTDVSLPSSWTKLNFDGVRFRVSPAGLVGYDGMGGFVYDPSTNVAITNVNGLCAAGDDLKARLSSFSHDLEAWTKYLDDKSCDSELKIKSNLPQAPQSDLTPPHGDCTGTYNNTIKWAKEFDRIMTTPQTPDERTAAWKADINNLTLQLYEGKYGQLYVNAGFEPLEPIGSARGKLLADYIYEEHLMSIKVGKKGTFSGTDVEPIIAYLKKIPAIMDRYHAIEKLYPPEEEIVGTKLSLQGSHVSVSDVWPVTTVASAFSSRGLQKPEFAEWLGWNFWRNDVIAETLTHVDYALVEPALDPAYADSTTYIYAKGKKLPVSSKRWETQFMSESFVGDGSNTEPGEAFPQWKLNGVESKKNLWLNWSKFLQSLTPDELRELVLSGAKIPYREGTLQVPADVIQMRILFAQNIPTVKIPGETGKMKEVPEIMHTAGLLIAGGLVLHLGRIDVRSVNVPTNWSGDYAPGLSLNKYLFFFMNSSVSKAADAVGWRVLRAVEKGKFAEAAAVLHELDKDLATTKATALNRERATVSRIPNGMYALIETNPSKEYQSLLKYMH